VATIGASRQPDVVLVAADEWRGDVLGHLGNPAAITPHLDALVAREAVSFARAFCQAPVCTPSRCSFLTGWYPHVRGHRTMHHMLQPDEPMLLRVLRAHGWIVWWGGKNDAVPAERGFEPYCDVRFVPRGAAPMWAPGDEATWRGRPGDPRYYGFLRGEIPCGPDGGPYPDGDWAAVRAAASFVREAPRDRPLCLFLALTYPHPPYGVEAPWFRAVPRHLVPPPVPPPEEGSGHPRTLAALRARQGVEGWDPSAWRELRAVYYGMCARVDAQVGALCEALRAAGRFEQTALFVFSDHGDFAGDFGLPEKAQNVFYEGLVRVPLVVKPPAWVPVRPGVREALVELTDLAATVYELAGIEPGYRHFGRSLVPLLRDPTAPGRDAVFAEGGRLPGEREATERESLEGLAVPERSLYWPRLALQIEDDVAHGKAVMCRTARYKYVYRLLEDDELYDLARDPGETHNLVHDPSYGAVREALAARLLRHLVETADVVPWQPNRR
jgi:arylsulfatase A-like enzyme